MAWNRIAALLIDGVLLALVAVPFMHFGKETQVHNGQEFETVKFGLGTTATVLWVVGGYAYFVLMEWLLGGTVGKLLLGIRVVRLDGEAASFLAVLVRNVLRLVDSFPYIIPYLVGFIVIGQNSGRRRLGDLAAGTAVVPKTEASYEVRLPASGGGDAGGPG